MKEWVVEEAAAPSALDGFTAMKTFTRVLASGALLVCVSGVSFLGYRLWTGRWPMQPEHHERNPFLPQRHAPSESGTAPAATS